VSNYEITVPFLFNDGRAKVFVTRDHRKVILVSKPVKKHPLMEKEIRTAKLLGKQSLFGLSFEVVKAGIDEFWDGPWRRGPF
jgi:hypothetical protein